MSATPGSSWTRELVELAALFVAVAAADLFANSFAHVSGGAVALICMGAFMVICAVVHHRFRHRAGRVSAAAPVVESGDVSTTATAHAGVWRVRSTVRDTPGSLAGLTASLACRSVNILSMQVHAVPDGVVDEFLVDAPVGARDIAAAVELGGGWDVTVEEADPHELVDIPTRILSMVTQDVAGGVDLARATRTLLGDCDLRWDATGEPTDGPAGTSMRLRDPEGGVLTVTRPRRDLTPAEYARVRAMLDLDREFATWLRAQHSVVLLTSGDELTVRQAGSADVPALAAMHGRCSRRSRRLRYLTGGTCPSAAELTRMVNRRHGRTLVVEHADGRIVAMANLMHDGAAAEAALLVEDSWQRKGIGTMLLRRLTTATPDTRHAYAVTEQSNAPMLSLLRRAGAEVDRVEDGLAHVKIPTR